MVSQLFPVSTLCTKALRKWDVLEVLLTVDSMRGGIPLETTSFLCCCWIDVKSNFKPFVFSGTVVDVLEKKPPSRDFSCVESGALDIKKGRCSVSAIATCRRLNTEGSRTDIERSLGSTTRFYQKHLAHVLSCTYTGNCFTLATGRRLIGAHRANDGDAGLVEGLDTGHII